MRNQWRLLLRHHQRHQLSSLSNISRPISFHSNQVKTFTLSSHVIPKNPTFNPLLLRYFSSDTPVEEKPSGHSLLLDIFSKPLTNDDIKQQLESNNVVISHDLVLSVLKDLGSNPSTGIKLFDWVLERESERLSSKSYNLMLKILGNNGFVKEFWDMVGVMKKKGYGVSKGTFIEVSNKFEKDGLRGDLEKLKGLFEKDVGGDCTRVSKIISKNVWDDGVEKELRELGVTYSSELVKMVLEKLSKDPLKDLIFFRWVEESGVFKHDEGSYNAMLLVLGREDCVDRFWNVVGEMKDAGHEMEMDTFIEVFGRFIKRKMVKEAVRLYEFAMNGVNKPSRQDCTLLLRKIVVAKELDMELFSRVVKAFTEKGFALDDSMLDAVLKSLTGVGRMKECNKVLEVLLESGYRPSGAMQARFAFDLSSSRMKKEVDEFIQKLEARGLTPDYKTWGSLIEGYCVAGDLKKASECLQKLVENEGFSSAGYSLDMLVNAYCTRDRPLGACKILADLVNRGDLKPWHTTYKALISKLLVQKCFKDALGLLPSMKDHGFPPFLDPFIAYLSRRGTADEAMLFFKAMTVKSFPSTSVFLRVFEAFSKAGRHDEAQNLLAKCPQYIRNHADVLNYFYSIKSEKSVEPAAAVSA